MQIQSRIESKLAEAFTPSHLSVTNESHMHKVPKGAESHFKVVVVAAAFDGKNLVERQRLVYAALAEELKAGVHALTMTTLTPAQWAESQTVPDSPLCRGGSK